MLAYMEKIRNRDESKSLAGNDTPQKQACRSHSPKAILHPEGTTADINSGVIFEKHNLSRKLIQAQGQSEDREIGIKFQPSDTLGSQRAKINPNSRNQGVRKFVIQPPGSPPKVKINTYKPESPERNT